MEQDLAGDKRRLARRAISEFERFRSALQHHEFRALQNIRGDLTLVGDRLLTLCGKLDIVIDADASIVRNAAHALHVAEIRGTDETGFAPETALLARLAPLVQDLRRLTADDAAE